VLNGAEGISEIAGGLVGQGMALFEALRSGIGQPGSSPDGSGGDGRGGRPDDGNGRPAIERNGTDPRG
jgi:hypothetical protein